MSTVRKRTRLADVARAAGVSTMTVVRVMRDPGRVARATRERVEAVLRETGYTPDLNASSLASQRSRLVGAIVPVLTNSLIAEIVRAGRDPVFVPLLMKLGVAPEAVLAAYRVADSPINAITPLNAYFVLIVAFAQEYQKDAGVGTVVSLMLPYVVIILVLWTLLLAAWHLLGLPWGLA